MIPTKRIDDLFAAAKTGGAPTDDDRARVRQEITAKLALAAVGGGAGAGAARWMTTKAAAKGGSAALTKLVPQGLGTKILLASLATVASGAVIAGVATGFVRAPAPQLVDVAPTTSHAAPLVTATPSPTAVPVAPIALAAPVATDVAAPAPSAATSSPSPLRSAPTASTHSASVPAAAAGAAGAPAVAVTNVAEAPEAPSPSASAAALAAEVTTLRQAKDTLERGDYPGALAAIADYDRRFPGGTLREEARVVRVLSLCGAGRTGEGRALASGMRSSVAWERMRVSCMIE